MSSLVSLCPPVCKPPSLVRFISVFSRVPPSVLPSTGCEYPISPIFFPCPQMPFLLGSPERECPSLACFPCPHMSPLATLQNVSVLAPYSHASHVLTCLPLAALQKVSVPRSSLACFPCPHMSPLRHSPERECCSLACFPCPHISAPRCSLGRECPSPARILSVSQHVLSPSPLSRT